MNYPVGKPSAWVTVSYKCLTIAKRKTVARLFAQKLAKITLMHQRVLVQGLTPSAPKQSFVCS